MNWTTTIALAHRDAEPIDDLRSLLHRDGSRLIPWSVGTEPPAGLKAADLLIVTAALASSLGEDGSKLRAALSPGVMIFALSQAPTRWADIVLNDATTPKVVLERINAALRLARHEWEARTRRTTITALTGAPGDEKALKPPAGAQVLHIGGPSAGFAGLQAMLARRNIELRPVLSAGLALDEIESGVIDAVLLDAAAAPQTLRELSIIMRRNSDLALCPVLVLDQSGTSSAQMRAPSLVADMIRNPSASEVIIARLEQLIDEQRRRRKAAYLLSRSRSKPVFDGRATLFSTRFLDAHLETHLSESQRTGRALALGLVRITPLEVVLTQTELESLAQQSGSLVARLIRYEDLAAPVSSSSIGILFPATLEAEAGIALKRISAVIKATRFHAPKFNDGVAVEVETTVTGMTMGLTSGEILRSAVQQLGVARAAV